jgi:hypothetical protein
MNKKIDSHIRVCKKNEFPFCMPHANIVSSAKPNLQGGISSIVMKFRKEVLSLLILRMHFEMSHILFALDEGVWDTKFAL